MRTNVHENITMLSSQIQIGNFEKNAKLTHSCMNNKKDRRTDNTMAKRKRTKGSKDRQYNGQKKMDKRIEGQTIQWPKGNGQKDRRTDNTMAKKLKDKWTNGQTMIYKTLHKKTTD